MQSPDYWINYWVGQEVMMDLDERDKWNPLENITQTFEVITKMEENDWFWELGKRSDNQYYFKLVSHSKDGLYDKDDRIVGCATTKERAICLTVLIATMLDSQIKDLIEIDKIDFSTVVVERKLF